MIIKTTRFGTVTIDRARIITMRGGGILGFENLTQYVLVTQGENNPFWWLQSVEDGAKAFVVINPFVVTTDYEPVISDDDAVLLEITQPDEVFIMTIVTVRPGGETITTNLRAPIVVNLTKHVAKQIVLDQEEYSVRFPIADNSVDPEKGKEKEKTAPTLSTVR